MADSAMKRVSGKSLGEILIEAGIVTKEQLDEALAYGKATGKRLGEALVDKGLITRDHIYWALGQQYGVSQVEVNPDMMDRDLLGRFPSSVLREHLLLPLIETEDELVVLTPDPLATAGVAAIQGFCPNKRISLQLASGAQIRMTLDALFPERPVEAEEEASVSVAEMAQMRQPEALVSPTGVKWMLSKAIMAGGDLLIVRRGEGGAAVVAGGTAGGIICEFDAAVLEGLEALAGGGLTELAPGLAGSYVWPRPAAYRDKSYVVSVAVLKSLGATGLRLRPLRLASPETAAIEEYALPEGQEQAIASAAGMAHSMGIIAVEPPMSQDSVLYHYVRELSRRHCSVLFFSASSRFCIPGVFQYPCEGEFAGRAVARLAAMTGASQVVVDVPMTVEECRALRFASPARPGVSVVYTVAPRPEGGGALPGSFWRLLEAKPEVTVLIAGAAGVEVMNAAQALSNLGKWR